ncbi:hypothetical protein B0A48_18602 [Cryoendolithus antarcticus]|uniref:Uncharacterized protein n=1 Tax=Cryoendolithus antarcticus TaxID=1507870 RepID=A0A1V8S8U7_9PEZI|nr:hypothetical protein B0A48_18602 [Cryoendolithus antarcticus]
MNEYRVPELNVQNGVLKALSFLFEYIREMGKEYVYATGAAVVKHVALGVVGLGCEDAMLQLLNPLIPKLFETSPHVIDRVIEAIDADRVAVGTGAMLNYVLGWAFRSGEKGPSAVLATLQ